MILSPRILFQRWYFRRWVWFSLRARRLVNRLLIDMLARLIDAAADVYWAVREFTERAEATWDVGPRTDDSGEPWPFEKVPAAVPQTPAVLCSACQQPLPEGQHRAAGAKE